MEQACVFHSQKSIYLTTKINKIINREILQTLFFKGSFHFVEKGDLRVRPGRCKAGGDVWRGGGVKEATLGEGEWIRKWAVSKECKGMGNTLHKQGMTYLYFYPLILFSLNIYSIVKGNLGGHNKSGETMDHCFE